MKRYTLDCRQIKITTRFQGGKRLPAVLAFATLLVLGMSPAAWAGAGGAGGAGEPTVGQAGGAGGSTTVTGSTGGAAGAGAGGGTGGTVGAVGTPGGNGGGATDGTSGGGGGGAGATTFQGTGNGDNPSGSTFDGGAAGSGGDASNGGGGGGGAGGNAVSITQATGTTTNEGTFNGGAGGEGGLSATGSGGNGGTGGSGIALQPLGAGGAAFVNTGTITGGAGGNGGFSNISGGGAGGNGGIGIEIQGSGVTVINSGVVSGGAAGGFSSPGGVSGTAGDAVFLNGDNNTLQLQAGSSITGNVVATGTGETLDLGGATNSTFDTSTLGASAQYQGFDSLTKDGSSTWTLTGTTTFTGSVAVNGGILEVSSQSNIGTGNLALNGGEFLTSASTTMSEGVALGQGTVNTLATVAGTTTTYSGIISDSTTAGALTIGDTTNTGTVVLSATNTYSGGTTVAGGTLEVSSQGNIGTGNLTLDNGEFLTSATTTISSTVTFTPNETNTLAAVAGTTATYSGDISSNNGGVTIGDATNTGTIVLSGNNAYTGGTTVTGGTTLEVSSQNNIGGGNLILDGGELLTTASTTMGEFVELEGSSPNTLAAVAGTTTTYSGLILGGGVLTVGDPTNTGTVVLTNFNDYGGGTTVSGGTLEVSSQNNIGFGNLTLNGGEFLTSTGTTMGEDVALTAGTTNTLATVAGTTTIYSGTISDSTTAGALTIGDGTNTGTIVLSGANTYSGGTTVTGATLEVSSQGNIGTGNLALIGGELLTTATTAMSEGVTLSAGATNTLAGSAGTTTTYSGAISDATTNGALTIGDGTNTGTIVLTHANTYSGGTTVNDATLEISSQGNIGTGNVVLNAGEVLTSASTTMGEGVTLTTGEINTLAAVAGTKTTYSGTISDATTDGALTIGDGANTGTIVLSGSNNYSGGTTVTGGAALEVASAANLGTGNIALDGGKLLTSTSTTVNKTVVLSSGVTNTLAAVAGTLVNYENIISDATTNGALTIGDGVNTGTVALTAVNSYSGGTTITGGATLATGSEVSLGTGIVTIDGGKLMILNDATMGNNIALSAGTTNTLAVATNATAYFFGTISHSTPTGALTIGASAEAGTVLIARANTYSGGTTIAAGTVVVGNAGAFGTGGVTLNGGTLTTNGPGGEQINIGGAYTQGNGGTLALNIASATVFDSLNVTGSGLSTLHGGLVLDFTGGYAPGHGQTFNLITTTGGIDPSISNLFIDPETNLAALHLTATGALTDGGDDYTVTVDATQLGFVGLFGGHYLTPNQLAVASNIDGYLDRNPSGTNALITALDRTSYSPAALGSAFNQLMPLNFARFSSSTAFNNTSFLTQQMDDYFANHRGADGTFLSSAGGIDYSGLSYDTADSDPALQQIHSRLLAWNPAPSTGLLDDSSAPVLGGVDMKDTKQMASTPSNEAPSLHFFVAGNAVLAQDFSDANTGLGHDDTTTGAIQLGADYAVTPHLLVGALFGFGHTDATLDDIGSTASVDTYSPGLYASYSNNGWYANALGSYGFSNYNQHRNIQFGGLTGTAQSNPDGDQIVGNLDGGYDFHQGHLTFGPTAGVQYVHLEVDSYNEYGLPAADLNVNDDQADSLRSRVGGHLSYAMKSGGVVYTPHFAASWQHEFLDQSRGITSQFDGLGAGSFVVQTQSPSRDSALLDMGLDAEINKTITVFGDYTVQAGQSNYFGQSIQAGVKVGF